MHDWLKVTEDGATAFVSQLRLEFLTLCQIIYKQVYLLNLVNLKNVKIR